MYSTHNEGKSGVAERFIKSINTWLLLVKIFILMI